MASNSFGTIFRITTWGESHGKAIGVVIDGCPAGLELSDDHINRALSKRAPGSSPYTSPRKETDHGEIYSGVFEDKTTGSPISIIIKNHDHDPSQYQTIKNTLRPGHANYTYLQKYGCFDYRGGGRASARETACRVAAGAVAQQILTANEITICTYLKSVHEHKANIADNIKLNELKALIRNDPIFCPDPKVAKQILQTITMSKQNQDSVGGIVEFRAWGIPVGVGDPIYDKLEAKLASAMLSIPASKGFEIGEGFHATKMQGSTHNDLFITDKTTKQILTKTNHSGGTLGGISTGMPLIGRVAFKPTSSIKQSQHTIDVHGNQTVMQLPENARHDPCVAIRAVPVVEAMCAIVLVDALLQQRCSQLRHPVA